jgi:hypothetical protein
MHDCGLTILEEADARAKPLKQDSKSKSEMNYIVFILLRGELKMLCEQWHPYVVVVALKALPSRGGKSE